MFPLGNKFYHTVRKKIVVSELACWVLGSGPINIYFRRGGAKLPQICLHEMITSHTRSSEFRRASMNKVTVCLVHLFWAHVVFSFNLSPSPTMHVHELPEAGPGIDRSLAASE